jgi:hypothetical protein
MLYWPFHGIQMVKNFHNSRQILGKSMAFGTIGGFVGGLVMSPFLIITAILVEMQPNTIPVAMGLMFGPFSNTNAMTVGFAMHMVTSVLIGIIFGVVTTLVGKLMITRFRKGIIEGIVTSMIAFVVLFIPISMAVMPPILMKMAMQINPSMTQEQIMSGMQQNMPTMFGLGILEHIIYGSILGAVTTLLIFKAGIKRNYQEQHAKEEWK